MRSDDELSRESDVEKQEVPTNSDGIISLEKDGSLITDSDEFCSENGRELSAESRSDAVDGEDAVESMAGETTNFDGTTPGKDGSSIEGKMENSGCDKAGAGESSVEGRINEVDGERDSVSESIESPVDHRATAGSPVPDFPETMTKGKGLRKWRRRRRREVHKEGGSGLDLHRVLKRGLPNVDPALNSPAQVGLIDDMHRNDGLIASPGSANDLGFSSSHNYGTTFQIRNQDSLSATRSSFVIGEDPDNSEDQGSRSSTAASVPRIDHDVNVQIDHKVEKVGGETFVQSSGFLTTHKNFDDGSKKSRTQKVNDFHGESEPLGIYVEGEDSSKIDEEVIHQGDLFTNVESDSSSVKVGGSPAGSLYSKHGSNCSDQCNGRWIQDQKHSWSYDCDGKVNQFECCDVGEAVKGENHIFDDSHTSCGQTNGVETEAELRGNGSVDTSDSKCQISPEDHRNFKNMEVERSTKPMNQNHSPHKERDSWRESVAQLQAAQDALEKEIHKIRAIGQATSLLPGISSKSLGSIDNHDNGKLQLENSEGNGFPSVEFLPIVLHYRVIHLENKLKEAYTVIKQKEQKLKELEAFIAQTNSQEHEIENNLKSRMNELETEIGSLFKDKIEAEVKYFIINETIKKFNYLVDDELPLLGSRGFFLTDQSQMLVKLKEAEAHSLLLKSRAEELAGACTILSETEEVLKMQNDVHKFSFFCFIQLMVLFIAILFSLSQLSRDLPGVVPT